MKQKSRKTQKKKKKGLNHAALDLTTVMLTRGIEFFAVLSSLLWAIEATAGKLPEIHVGRSISSLAIPNKKSNLNVEIFQSSRLKQVFQTQFQPAPLTLLPENAAALSFKQSPFFVQAQIEFLRFPTFFKK
jgi:hypothetical protein